MAEKLQLDGTLSVLRFRLAGLAPNLVALLTAPPAAETVAEGCGLRENLRDELTQSVQNSLNAQFEVSEVVLRPVDASARTELDVKTVVTANGAAMETGPLLEGLSESRSQVPERARAFISTWSGADVSATPASLELGDGFLGADTDGGAATSDAPASREELIKYAGLALVVLFLIGFLILAGVALLGGP